MKQNVMSYQTQACGQSVFLSYCSDTSFFSKFALFDVQKTYGFQAEENLRITQLGYRQEAATSTEVLDAQTDLTQAETNYFQSLYGYLDALATLEYAVGQTAKNGPDLNMNS